MTRDQFDRTMESVNEHDGEFLAALLDRLAAYYLDVDADQIEPNEFKIEFEALVKRHADLPERVRRDRKPISGPVLGRESA